MKHGAVFLREINRNNVWNHEILYTSLGELLFCCLLCFYSVNNLFYRKEYPLHYYC